MNTTNIWGEACETVWTTPGKQPTLRADIKPRLNLVTILGWVKKKNDGRWTWWVSGKNDWFRPAAEKSVVEGVAATEAEAKLKVQEHWGTK